MLVVARAILNLELQISYFHRGGMEQIFHVQLVLLYLFMRVTKTNWPEAFRTRTAHAIAATDNVKMLQIINDSALAKINSMSTKLKGGLSISENYKPLARNSTSMISGKTFNVITVECPFSSLMGSQGAAATTSIQSNFGNRSNNNILSLMSKSIIANGVMETKPFEYNGSDRTYKLAIVVCNQLFSSNSNYTPQDKPDITKYTKFINSTASTLKLE